MKHGGESSGLLDIRSMAAAHLGSGSRMAHSAARVAAAVEPPSFAAPSAIVPTAPAAGSRRIIKVLAAIGAAEVIVIAVCGVLIATRGPAATARAVIATQVAPRPAAVAATPAAVATAPARVSPPPIAVAAPPEPPPPEPSLPVTAMSPKASPSKAAPLVRHPPSTKLSEPAAPAARAACDEISCIADATGWCCPRLLATPTAPTSVDAHAVTTAMAQIHDRAMACGPKSGAKGKVRVHLAVDPDGHVAKAAIESTPEAALGECVLRVVQSAPFKRTDRGGSFGYSFVF